MKETQRGAVLKYLQKNHSITSKEAFEKFGATRLSAIIFDFRKMGYNIETVNEHTVNRYGSPVCYARYVYHEE